METQIEQKLDTALNVANHDRNQAMLDFAKRLYAPIIQELEATISGLRQRLLLSEAENSDLLEAMHDANAELGADYIHARRCANTWKEAAKEWRHNAILGAGTIDRSIESPVTERAEMAQARYVIHELMNLIEGWEHLPACPRWLSDEAERLTAGAVTLWDLRRPEDTQHDELVAALAGKHSKFGNVPDTLDELASQIDYNSSNPGWSTLFAWAVLLRLMAEEQRAVLARLPGEAGEGA